MSDTIKINRGLKGIYFERSGVSEIKGAEGKLSYRAIPFMILPHSRPLKKPPIS